MERKRTAVKTEQSRHPENQIRARKNNTTCRQRWVSFDLETTAYWGKVPLCYCYFCFGGKNVKLHSLKSKLVKHVHVEGSCRKRVFHCKRDFGGVNKRLWAAVLQCSNTSSALWCLYGCVCSIVHIHACMHAFIVTY